MPSRRTALAALAALATARVGRAQAPAELPPDFPRKPITLVSPLSPGGPIDLLARILAQGFQAATGQPAVVENRSGGAGNIGIDAVRRAPADGATMLVVPAGNLTINPTLLRNLTWSLERDFAPVSVLAAAPNLLVCNPALPVRDVAGLVAAAKARPGALSYGSPGVGSQLHLAVELFKQKTGADITHVPYRGTGPALTDVISGQIPLMVSNVPAVLEALRGGQVRALAMTTAERSPLLPEVPTLREAGVEGIDVTSWYGLLVPRAVPAPVVRAVFEASAALLRAPETAGRIEAQGMAVVCEPPDVFAARLRRETAAWAQVIREQGITAD